MMITRYCSQCGAETVFDDSREYAYCSYCGARVSSYPMKALNTSMVPQTTEPAYPMYPERTMTAATTQNLVIDYSTTHPGYSLTVLVDGQQWVFPNGAKKEFTLRAGQHILGFRIAVRLWNRRIFIPYEGAQVSINVVYAGRTKIYIYPPQ